MTTTELTKLVKKWRRFERNAHSQFLHDCANELEPIANALIAEGEYLFDVAHDKTRSHEDRLDQIKDILCGLASLEEVLPPEQGRRKPLPGTLKAEAGFADYLRAAFATNKRSVPQ